MSVRLLVGDCRELLATLPDSSVQCVVTSPPYFGLRDYGTASWEGGDEGCDHAPERQARTGRERSGLTGSLEYVEAQEPAFRDSCGKCGARRIDAQIGLESTVEAYVAELVGVFREVRRCLRDDGVLFLNLGDSYASAWPCNRRSTIGAGSLENGKREARPPRMPGGLKEKDLIGVPWWVAFALQADGWYLRSDIIWAKPNPMPESVRDRPTKAHEYIFLLTKQAKYFWDADAVKETGVEPDRHRNDRIGGANGHTVRHSEGAMIGASATRNIRSVWTIATAPFAEAHFATFPPALAERCIKAGTSEKGACGACGAPWVRVVEREPNPLGVNGGGHREVVRNTALSTSGQRDLEREKRGYGAQTTGWQPTCACDAPTVPCVVLDPFGGAGTVSLVAERLGRDSIYIDLSESYATMAENRLRSDGPMFLDIQRAPDRERIAALAGSESCRDD